jgi:hypothetical protein
VSFLDNLFRSTTATELATTGDPVNVSHADPPGPHQVLKRGADAGHAVWSESSGGATDVDWCYPEELPDYDRVETPTGYRLEGSGVSPGKLVLDGVGNYSVGDTLLVAFDVGNIERVAVFTVLANVAADDWQLELLYAFPAAEDLPNSSELEYRIARGEQYGGRRFRTNAKGNTLMPQYYVLQRDPLECWPPDGTFLDGTTGGSFEHKSNKVLAGRDNQLSVTGSHTLKLVCPAAELCKGERFGLTVAENGGSSWTIDASDTDATGISAPDGEVSGTSITFNLLIGTHIEWQLCPDGVWHVVAYIEGFMPS